MPRLNFSSRSLSRVELDQRSREASRGTEGWQTCMGLPCQGAFPPLLGRTRRASRNRASKRRAQSPVRRHEPTHAGGARLPRPARTAAIRQ
jgi:hypothetical protein